MMHRIPFLTHESHSGLKMLNADLILRSAGIVTQTGVILKMIHGAQSTPEGKIECCLALWLRTSRAN